MIKIYDGRKGFYQWDLDQKLIIGFENDCRVHFYNPRRLSNTALVVETYMIGGKKVADVPNALLQHDGTLVAWVYKTVGDKCTVEQAKFAVQKRQKPDDYVYTPTEVFDFEELKREVEGKITMPDGGEVGNVLKKTADGAEWGEDSEGKVNSVNGVEPDESGNVQLDASDVGALPDDTFIPTKTSELENDSGFLTEHQSLSAYRTAVEQDAIDEGKVDVEEGKGLSSNDFTDTLKEKLDGIADDADNTKAVLTDTAAAAWTGIEKANACARIGANIAIDSWAGVQAAVKAGKASKYFKIGDELICKYRYQGTDYDWTWAVADFRNAELQNGSIAPGMVLQSKFCTIESIVFDSPEQVEATEATAQEGVYYYGLTGTTVSAANLTLLSLSTGDTIPYASYDKVFKSSVRDTSKNIIQNGYNRYLWSAIRKWLNSDKGVGEDWFGELDHIGQVKPANALTLAGFMAGLDEDFLTVVNPTKIQVATNTVTDGGVTDVMYDKFWLPSVEEMFGAPQVEGIEGNYFPYWKNRSGLTTRSNDAVDGRKILPINSTSSKNCRLRSAYRPFSYYAWYCSSSGTLNVDVTGSTGYRLAPACVIC